MPTIIIVAGPTASGKSSLALALAEQFGGTIINADSMQIYRELRILTARPSEAEERRIPHRLYGIQASAKAGSAAEWRNWAQDEIDLAIAEGRVPILTGGTGLYLRVLLNGIAPVPPVPQSARVQTQQLFDELGPEEFHARLSALDPETAASLPVKDRHRLVRAYEVVNLTGRGLAAWRQDADPKYKPYRTLAIFLDPPRPDLYDRINRRFEQMIETGGVEEARVLATMGLNSSLPIMKVLGIPELIQYLNGDIDLSQAVALGQRNTRRYAKRQRTWFLNQMQLDLIAQDSESSRAEIFSFVSEFLLTQGK